MKFIKVSRELALSHQITKPKPNSMFLDVVGTKTNGEFFESICDVLKVIVLDNDGETTSAYDIAESVFLNEAQGGFYHDDKCKYNQNEMLVATSFGRCEGEMVKIYVENDEGLPVLYCSIKFITGDLDLVSRIGNEVYKAIYRGY